MSRSRSVRGSFWRRYPKTIRLGNGPEFISKEPDLWAFLHDVTLD